MTDSRNKTVVKTSMALGHDYITQMHRFYFILMDKGAKNMNIQVRYYSRGGNTKKLAERAFPQFQKKLQDKGIQVDSKNFYQKHLFKKLGLTKNC